MKEAKNIIITNIGRRGYLVDYIKESPSFKGKIYVSDCDETASGLYGDNDGKFILPRPIDNENKYVQKLTELCIKKKIQIVIPIIDPEIYILSQYREEMLSHGINIIVSSKHVLDICYNKLLMNEFLAEKGFLVPKTYKKIDDFNLDHSNNLVKFPVIVKPICGSGSMDTFVVNNIEQLKSQFHDGQIIQELLIGKELGIDIFNTFDKKPVRCVIKKKISMRSGETDKSLTIENKEIQLLAIKLGNYLGHIGNLDCDIICTPTGSYIIDLNPRFGGGYPATHSAGCNLLELLVCMCNGDCIEEDFDSYTKNLLVMKSIKVTTHLIHNP